MRVQRIGHYRMNSVLYYVQLLYGGEFVRQALRRNLSLRRAFNALAAIIEWKAKRSRVVSRPFLIRIEPSAVCNLRCPGCMTPTKTFLPGAVRMMALSTFERVLAATRDLGMRMTFYMEGEPTTHPKLFEMIGMATRARLFTSISTNFTLMRKEWLARIFQSGLDYISVCLDGFTQGAYERYRIGGDVSKVKAGLEMMMAYKRNGKYRRPFVNVYSIRFGHVVPEMDRIEAYCRELDVDQLTFRPDECNFDGTTPQVSDPKPQPLHKCYWPWLSMQVDVDGSVYPCPIAFQHVDREPYGNINAGDFEDVWNGERYRTTREYLAGRIAEDDGRLKTLPCRKCRWYGTHTQVERPRSIAMVAARRASSG